jgi:hypothetical protein
MKREASPSIIRFLSFVFHTNAGLALGLITSSLLTVMMYLSLNARYQTQINDVPSLALRQPSRIGHK